jgi:hypothetical protein
VTTLDAVTPRRDEAWISGSTLTIKVDGEARQFQRSS